MAFICWAAAERNPWFAIPLEAAVGRLGRPPAADPNAPGPLAFRDRERVADLLRSAGLEKVTAREEATVLTPPGNRRQVAAMAVRLGPATRVVRHFDGTDADRAAIEEEVFARLEPYATGQGVRIPAAVNVFAAVRG